MVTISDALHSTGRSGLVVVASLLFNLARNLRTNSALEGLEDTYDHVSSKAPQNEVSAASNATICQCDCPSPFIRDRAVREIVITGGKMLSMKGLLCLRPA